MKLLSELIWRTSILIPIIIDSCIDFYSGCSNQQQYNQNSILAKWEGSIFDLNMNSIEKQQFKPIEAYVIIKASTTSFYISKYASMIREFKAFSWQ